MPSSIKMIVAGCIVVLIVGGGIGLGIFTEQEDNWLPDLPPVEHHDFVSEIVPLKGYDEIESRSKQFGLIPLRLSPSHDFEFRLWSSPDETGIEKCIIYRRIADRHSAEIITPRIAYGSDPPDTSEFIPVDKRVINLTDDFSARVGQLVSIFHVSPPLVRDSERTNPDDIPILDESIVTLEVAELGRYDFRAVGVFSTSPSARKVVEFCSEIARFFQIDMGCRQPQVVADN